MVTRGFKWFRMALFMVQVMSNGFNGFHVVAGASIGFGKLKMVSRWFHGGLKWFQMVSGGFRWLQFVSDEFRWSHMISVEFQRLSSGVRWCQMSFMWFHVVSRSFRWFWVASGGFRWFTHGFQMVSN